MTSNSSCGSSHWSRLPSFDHAALIFQLLGAQSFDRELQHRRIRWNLILLWSLFPWFTIICLNERVSSDADAIYLLRLWYLVETWLWGGLVYGQLLLQVSLVLQGAGSALVRQLALQLFQELLVALQFLLALFWASLRPPSVSLPGSWLQTPGNGSLPRLHGGLVCQLFDVLILIHIQGKQ